MRRKLFYRLSLTVLALLMAILPAAAADALTFIEGNYDSISLYDPAGKRVDNMVDISAGGYIIRSRAQSDAVFSSPFGTITTNGQALFSVTGISADAPSIYLLDGILTLHITADVPLTVYTTTARYDVDGAGTYQIFYTEDEDLFLVIEGADVKVSDPLRSQSYKITAGSYVNLLSDTVETRTGEVVAMTENNVEGTLSMFGYTLTYSLGRENGTFTYPEFITVADADDFFNFLAETNPEFAASSYSLTDGKAVVSYGIRLTASEREVLASYFADFISAYLTKLLVPPAPVFGSVTTEFNPLVSGEQLIGSFAVSYKLFEEYGIITIPAGITSADVESFFAYIATAHPEVVRGINYRFDGDQVILLYNARLNVKELNYGIALLASYVTEYLNPAPVVPAEPVFVNAGLVDTSLLEGSISREGYMLTYSLGDETGIITYPSIVTKADVDDFFNYIMAAEPEFLRGLTYTFVGDNQVAISYGTVIPKNVREALIPAFEFYLDAYITELLTPETPVITGVVIIPIAPSITESELVPVPPVPAKPVVENWVVTIPDAPVIVKGGYADDEEEEFLIPDTPSITSGGYTENEAEEEEEPVILVPDTPVITSGAYAAPEAPAILSGAYLEK